MKKKAVWAGLTLLLIASTAIVACKQQVPPAPEVKGEIVIGHLEGLSGPLAGTGIPYTDGGQDAIMYLNEDKGGIQGYKLRSIVIDHKMDAALALAGWDRIKSEGATVVMAQTAATALLWELPNRDGIPMVIGGVLAWNICFLQSRAIFSVLRLFFLSSTIRGWK